MFVNKKHALVLSVLLAAGTTVSCASNPEMTKSECYELFNQLSSQTADPAVQVTYAFDKGVCDLSVNHPAELGETWAPALFLKAFAPVNKPVSASTVSRKNDHFELSNGKYKVTFKEVRRL